MSAAERIGGFSDVARTKGNFGLEDVGFPASVDASTAQSLAAEWVGSDAVVNSNGSALISSNGLKQFRLPTAKSYSLDTVANFEWRSEPNGSWMGNGHLTVTPDIEAG
jgi:filamentous hemagglutinin